MTPTNAPHAPDGQISFTFNGQDYRAREGETLAAALLRAGVLTLSEATGDHSPRGAFCWMGWCQECRVQYQGRLVEACRLVVHNGLEAQARQAFDAG